MSRTVLEVNNLAIEFGPQRTPVRAVQGVSLALREGQTHTLVGNSGSGKSALAHALLRLLPTAGRITGGEVVYHHYDTADQLKPSRTETITSYGANSEPMRQLRAEHLSMIFQEPASALSPVHTCGDTIATAIGLRWPTLPKREVVRRVFEVLEQLMFSDPQATAKRYPFELSGGMRQRICIAIAIASHPKVLIADEPTTALDVTTQKEILILLEAMKRAYGLTVLFITHDMAVAAQISDEIMVMEKGLIVERKPAVELFDNPVHPHTKALVGSNMILEKRAARKVEADRSGKVVEASPVLAVRDLSVTFSQNSYGLFWRTAHVLRAVDGISFDLFPGETLGVVGESGSGKTTLARCIVGLYRPCGGSIRFRHGADDIELVRYRYRKADPMYRHIRMVFQDPFASLNPRLNVYNNIAEPLLIAGLRRSEIRPVVAGTLEKVGLHADMMERYPHQFSGGERQRICIARAVIMHPTILIADEATASLDVSLRAQILDLLNELQQTLHFSILLITHDINTVKYCADRMVVMKQGRIVEGGPVEDVVNNPQEAYTRTLIEAVPLSDPRRRTLLIGNVNKVLP